MKADIMDIAGKRAIAEIMRRQYDTKIKEVQNQEDNTMSGIVAKIQKALGISIIDKEIQQLKDKVVFLEKKKTDMGFRYNNFDTTWEGNKSIVNRRTKAGELYYKIRDKAPDIQLLQTQCDNAIKDLWLETDRDKVRGIARTTPTLKSIIYKG